MGSQNYELVFYIYSKVLVSLVSIIFTTLLWHLHILYLARLTAECKKQ